MHGLVELRLLGALTRALLTPVDMQLVEWSDSVIEMMENFE